MFAQANRRADFALVKNMLQLPDMIAHSARPAHDPQHERRQLYQELAQAAQEARLLDSVLSAVAGAGERDELIRAVGFGIKEILPYERWRQVNLAVLEDEALQVYQLIGERNNPFWDAVGKGIKAAADDLGVTARFVMATMDSSVTQEMLIDRAIAERVSGIALAPADSEAMEPAIRRARQAGIPLITFATPPVARSAALLDIGVDNLRAGRMAGEALLRLLPAGGTVATSVYSYEQANMRRRIEGFAAALAGTPLTPLPPIAVYDDREHGLSEGRRILAEHPELAAAFGAASLNGPLWAMCFDEARRGGQAPVVGFDLVPATVAMLKAGLIEATIVQREYEMGYRCIELLCRLISGGVEATLAQLPASRFIEVGLDLVTLERSPWSVALADYLKQPGARRADQALIDLVAGRRPPLNLLVIGILPQADPDILCRRVSREPGSLIERVLGAERPLVLAPSPEDGAPFAEPASRGVRTFVGVPLRTAQHVIGALMLESAVAEACSAEELAIIERIARVIVVAWENSRLLRQAVERRQELESVNRQQEILLQTILDLSSPVAAIVPGILVMPLMGLIDSRRAGQFLDHLLTAITRHRAAIVLIDIAAVSVVDTGVANAIIQAAGAARLLGAEVVLVGITPSVAQTMVSLGIDLSQMTTFADLQAGFTYALAHRNGRIVYQRASKTHSST